jgi:DNA-binding TFAR19-related protein (PDSD5 family)
MGGAAIEAELLDSQTGEQLLAIREIQQEKKKLTDEKQLRPREILKTILVGRAWEVLNAAAAQFPEPTRLLEAELARLVREGKLKGPITAEQLMGLFRRLGLDVRLETKIQVLESGELKSLAAKFKGE